MKPNLRSYVLVGSLTLLLLAACGQNIQTPIINPSSVETALASTARVLAQQTETALGYTPTPQITPTETLTPTPRVSSTGTSLEKLADGSTRFTDHKAGIQVVFPVNWLTLRVGETEYYQAWEKETAKNPMFQDIFATMQNADPNLFRVTSLDMRSEITYKTYAKMEIVFAPNDERTLNEIRISQAQKKYPLTGYKLLSSRLEKSAAGFDTAVIEFQWDAVTPQNEKSLNYHKEILLKTSTGAIAIQLYTVMDQKENVMPEYEKLINSLIFLDEQK